MEDREIERQREKNRVLKNLAQHFAPFVLWNFCSLSTASALLYTHTDTHKKSVPCCCGDGVWCVFVCACVVGWIWYRSTVTRISLTSTCQQNSTMSRHKFPQNFFSLFLSFFLLHSFHSLHCTVCMCICVLYTASAAADVPFSNIRCRGGGGRADSSVEILFDWEKERKESNNAWTRWWRTEEERTAVRKWQ